ncbi:hypothetical protein NTE_01709 [Candidatus Nitrososphaera evergladensis SR1]|uniref:Uncharacterized protein n=1 Tax=Candidatus Nitrososphaera evergladensis SR1 TaxID=1459636 RepID=A0A075MRQ8_9ARCH|nr:hypothetical protein [Candidatus Nitrososphaera evergladensis]AIF83770.1 hypothetical protein NTE_01709 [Candidatus Nitrososphaera evergladensis SR1]
MLLKAAGSIAIAVILAAVLATSSLTNRAYAATISGYSETKVIVKGDQQHCLQVDATKVAGLQFRDFSGNGIKQVAAGSQVSVQAIINSGCDVADYPATVLLEVRDSDGITKYLAFQQIALEPSQWSRISFSWVPDKPGNYDVRTFVMTCIACSGLNPVTMHRISVY